MPPAASFPGGRCHIPCSSTPHSARCRASAPILCHPQENESHLQIKDLSHVFGCKPSSPMPGGEAWVDPGCRGVPMGGAGDSSSNGVAHGSPQSIFMVSWQNKMIFPRTERGRCLLGLVFIFQLKYPLFNQLVVISPCKMSLTEHER